jgi:hypothetical protein
MFFPWLRGVVKDAVLGGISDAVQEIAPDGSAGGADALGLLRAKLLPALPAPAQTDAADTAPVPTEMPAAASWGLHLARRRAPRRHRPGPTDRRRPPQQEGVPAWTGQKTLADAAGLCSG